MAVKVGIIFNFNQLPDTSKFCFVINKRNGSNSVKKGLFVHCKSLEGFLIGVVENIALDNEYFSDALTIKSYNADNNPQILKGLFPSEDFEFAVAIVKTLGVIEFKDKSDVAIKRINRATYPPNPGSEVFLVENDILTQFLGFDPERGLCLGKVKVTNIEAKINMDRLLNKHFSILAVSGGGKSYLTSVLIEELLTRKNEYGAPGIVLIDVHGEYSYLKNVPQLREQVKIYDSNFFQIAVPNLNAYSFKKYQEQISYVQIRELSNFIKQLQKDQTKNNQYTLHDLIDLIEKSNGGKSTKQALIGWLLDLENLTIFGPQENPSTKNLVNPKEIAIINLQSETNLRKKQIAVEYICNRLFYLRRENKIPPFLLIIEEAHQFCPEAAEAKAISKSVIETIAREGRKFMLCLCLISQRPKKLSTTALSQCNSKLVLNIKNPYDLKHLMESSESITKEYAEMISSLGVGEMLVMGSAVNYPVFVDVRERTYKSQVEDVSLSQVCLKWQKSELT